MDRSDVLAVARKIVASADKWTDGLAGSQTVAMARELLDVDVVLRECWCDEPGTDADRHVNAAIVVMRRRLGLGEGG